MKTVINPLSFYGPILVIFQQLFVNLLLTTTTITLASNTTVSFDQGNSENYSLPAVEIIKNYGYAVEIHNIITKDGYILELHRMPKSKSSDKPSRNYPVFFHHAFLSSSTEWIIGGPNTSLSMQLVDDGYDVWLANCRGNTYSRKHVSMNPKQNDFWNFSLHEIGTYDLPAAIDYILMKTNSSQLHYIGYSMGTSLFYIMASERPEYHSKIRSQISFAPVAYMSNMKSPIRYLFHFAKLFNIINQRLWNGIAFPQSSLTTFFAKVVCGVKITQKLICQKGLLFFVSGSDPFLFNSEFIPQIMGHYPNGISSKVVEHFAQLRLKDNFGQYDYGPTLNLKYYNNTKSPTYNLSSIQVPITLMYGENDKITDPKDVMKLKAVLPKLMDVIKVDNPYCNHLDFLFSLKVNEHVNDPVKKILRKTDNTEWEYSGQNPSAIQEATIDNNHKKSDGTIKRSPNPVNELSFVEDLNYLTKNLNTIIATSIPRSADYKNVADFERDLEAQQILFGNLIKFLQSIEKKYGRFSDWSSKLNRIVR